MAVYTHNATATVVDWYNVNIDGDNPTTATNSILVLPNSDGTFTRLHSAANDFTYSGGTPTGGTITSIDRSTDSAGTTILETVTGLNLSLVTLTNSPGEGNRTAFALIFQNADTFNGYGGNDLFVGGPAADSFIGNGGTNTVSYDNALAAVRADLGNQASNTGDAAGDNYNASIANLIGSDFNDTLIGNANANSLSGGLGNDVLGPGGSNDTVDGGAGTDVVSYSNAVNPVTVLFDTASSATGTGIGTDTLISVEGARGGTVGDFFTATTNFNASNGISNEFEGLGGNDTITGNGQTRVSYSLATNAVTVNLLAGSAQATGADAGIGVDSFAGVIGPDSINRVNSVRGSDFGDTLTGAGARGFLQFIGLRGDDIITGSTEAINNFDSNTARYDIVSFAAGTINGGIAVVLDTTSTVTDIGGGNAVGTDTLINVERVRGSSQADTFTANAGFSGPYGALNFFEGMGGNDTITGNGHTFIQYTNALAAVTVDLQAGSAQSTAGGDAAGIGIDNITGGVNAVSGSLFNDTISGTDGAQAEDFSGGNDGIDTIDGRGGILDRLNYRADVGGITANLTTNTFIDGAGNSDIVSNIEGIRGSEFGDSITGDGNVNRLQGENGDDQLFGMDGNDFLVGDDGVNLYANAFGNSTSFDTGNDLLDGGIGADQMWGGAGNDTYFVDDGGDAVTENAAEGTDTVHATISYALGPNVENLILDGSGNINGIGNGLDNQITGNSGNNALTGGAGADTMAGGSGSDVYFVDSLNDVINENLNEGSDTVVPSVSGYTLGPNVEDAILGLGTGGTVTGNGLNNALYGNAGNDTLNGLAGNDFLDGQGGADTMAGGTEDDIYVVNVLGDVINENLNEGNDTAYIGVSGYTLGANVENGLILVTPGTTLTGNGLNNALYGNAGNDTINAGAGDDTIDGGGGADTMAGGANNDLYAVNNLGDVINENAPDGTDTAYVVVSGYTMGANVEGGIIGITTGATLTGNNQANALYGNAGNDTLNGLGGNDSLDGGAGADTMAGGTGDDLYAVDNVGDVITENAPDGSDVAYVVVSGYTMAANVEGGIVGITTGATLTGNGLDNRIFGNAGSDTLNGLGGNDTLDGGGGTDTMAGGTGNDAYFVDNLGDVLTENLNEGTDTAYVLVNGYTLAANVDNAQILLGSATTLTGNGISNVLSGNAGNDTLDGAAGTDTLVGGGGNDTFAFKDGYGADTVFDFKASGNQDVIDLTGVSSIHTFADVQGHAAQVANDTVITLDANNSLTLLGVQLNTLQQQDFLLA